MFWLRKPGALSFKSAPASPTAHTFEAKIDPLANRLNTSEHLKTITLDQILGGDTCPPIGLRDYEAYLSRKEYNLESLQFVVWYKGYRHRYLIGIEGVTDIPKDDPAASEVQMCAGVLPGGRRGSCAVVNLPPSLAPSSCAANQLCTPSSKADRRASAPPPSTGVPTTVSASSDPTKAAAFRTEGMNAIATFLTPGNPKELNVDATMRIECTRRVAYSIHPDIFSDIYDHIHYCLELSVPRFIAYATPNTNRYLQVFWYVLGAMDLFIGFAISICLIVLLPTPPEHNRAWRLFGLPFASLGAMQMYSAWRGFCSRVWRRNAHQVHVWRLNEFDGQDEQTISPGASTYATANSEEYTASWDVEPSKEASLMDDPMHHSLTRFMGHSILPSFVVQKNVESSAGDEHTRSSWLASASKLPVTIFGWPSRMLKGQKLTKSRPPVWGPESVVLDPRIQAVHAKMRRDLLVFGGCFAFVFTAVVLSVPSRNGM